jgi:hypothetical protein
MRQNIYDGGPSQSSIVCLDDGRQTRRGMPRDLGPEPSVPASTTAAWPRSALAQCAIVEQPRCFMALRPSRHLALVIAIVASAPLRRHPDASASSGDR